MTLDDEPTELDLEPWHLEAESDCRNNLGILWRQMLGADEAQAPARSVSDAKALPTMPVPG